jgi:hypothetical protein
MAFQPAEHDLDPVAPFVTTLVVLNRFLPLLPARDAGAYPFVLQRFPEPISVIATIHEQPIDIRQAVQQCPHTSVIADLTGGNEQVERTSSVVGKGPLVDQIFVERLWRILKYECVYL